MKIVTIVGARPQFVKASVVSSALKNSNLLEEIIIHTGQHFDHNMSEIFFDELSIPKPKYNLGINSLSHGAMTGQMLEQIENILFSENPDLVLVYGDTNSTLAGALAAKKLGIKVAHIEAGLRSFNNSMPEEINRIITDRISDILFCPNMVSMANLKNEGITSSLIFNVGDVMQDAIISGMNKMRKPNIDLPNIFALCTIHRAENTDHIERLESTFQGLNIISENLKIVLPIHPRTKNIINYHGLNISENIQMIDPVGYMEMIYLIQKSKIVLTDSGGLQKEAYMLSKNCITLREETEWVELIETGRNKLVGCNKDKIVDAFNYFKNNLDTEFTKLYGNGDSAIKISEILINQLR